MESMGMQCGLMSVTHPVVACRRRRAPHPVVRLVTRRPLKPPVSRRRFATSSAVADAQC